VNPRPLALVSGIPATGKSSFGRWLAEHHGFIHIDVENGGFRCVNLHAEWVRAVGGPVPDVRPLVDGLSAFNRPVIVDWGYPPSWLPRVGALHAAGVAAWWFDGDHDAARRSFINRGTISVQALDAQMAGIQAVCRELRSFYGARMIPTISSDGSFLS
jgi:hypothetical protein